MRPERIDGDVIGAACAMKVDAFELSDLLVAHTLSDAVDVDVDADLLVSADEVCGAFFSELSDQE